MSQPSPGVPSSNAASDDGPVVLGIDPGRRWTAGVLRAGTAALYGWTLGPVDEEGEPLPAATDNVHDIAAWARYASRLLDTIEDTLAAAPALLAAEGLDHRAGERVRLACEVVLPPAGRRVPLVDWLVPRQLMTAIAAYDPSVVLVPLGQHGKRRPITQHYPPALWPTKGKTGGRPDSWGPCEAYQRDRDHERSAYDVAGVAAQLLASGAAR